mgnify:CR=1 FL=1
MRRLLIMVRKEFLSTPNSTDTKKSSYQGLCAVSDMLESISFITYEEEREVNDYIRKHGKKWFKPQYNKNGVTMRFEHRNLYIWKPYTIKGRVKFLDKHIENTIYP